MNPSGILKPLRRIFGSDPKPAPDQPASALSAPGGIVLQHTWSSEPNALKLQANRLLLPLGTKRAYTDAIQAVESPLAATLFAMGGLTSVEIDGSFLTVLMHDDADWDALMGQVPDVIRAHLEAGKPVVTGIDTAAPKPTTGGGQYKFGFQHVTRTPEEQFKLVQQLFDSEINPAVAAHGGHFTLLEVKENRVFVKLGGGCQGCGMADVTLRQGVEQRLKEVMPEMAALIDVTDHAAGQNPYYQPSK